MHRILARADLSAEAEYATDKLEDNAQRLPSVELEEYATLALDNAESPLGAHAHQTHNAQQDRYARAEAAWFQ